MGRAANRRLQRTKVGMVLMAIWLISAKKAEAQVVINEFLPDPTDANDESEWIELYNLGKEKINVAGWQLDDSDGGTKPYNIPENYLPPGGLLTLEKNDSHIGLNNTEDQVRLWDNLGTLLDSVSYQGIPEGKSYSRIPDGSANWQITEVPTKNVINLKAATAETPVTNTPSLQQPGSLKLKFSEVYACPESGFPEWVELVNEADNEAELEGVKIQDSAGNSFLFSGSIPGKGLMTFEWTRGFINNSGDQVELTDNDEVFDKALLPACSPETSTIKSAEEWINTTAITKNASNKLSIVLTPTKPLSLTAKKTTEQKTAEVETSIEEDKDLEDKKPDVLGESLVSLAKTASSSAYTIRPGIINEATLGSVLSTISAGTNVKPNQNNGGLLVAAGGACLCAGAVYGLKRKIGN